MFVFLCVSVPPSLSHMSQLPVTKPPVKSKLSYKDEHCHRLVRLLMRAYYEKEHIVVIDCLLDLQIKQGNKLGVSEIDLSTELHLSPKLIREVLNRLRHDQIVKGVQKNDNIAATKIEELTAKGKRKTYQRAPTVTFTWHIDFEQLVNVIKFRHWDIFEKLNKKVDRTEVYYICPTLDCINHSLTMKKSVMDLLLEQGSNMSNNKGDGIFRCDSCFITDFTNNAKQGTPLVLVTQTDMNTTTNNNNSSNTNTTIPPSADRRENMKNKFNRQLGVLLEQLMKVDKILQEELINKKELIAAGLTAAAIAADKGMGGGGGGSNIHSESKTNQLIDFNSASTAGHAAAASSTTATVTPASSVESMIQVDIAGSSAPVLPIQRTVGMDHVISTLNNQALPWDKNAAPLSLAKVEEESRALALAQSKAVADEKLRKEEEEKKRFEIEYKELLKKQQANIHNITQQQQQVQHEQGQGNMNNEGNMDEPVRKFNRVFGMQVTSLFWAMRFHSYFCFLHSSLFLSFFV